MGLILVRGGGDLASGVALRLHRAGLRVAITELPSPLAVRRAVSFCEAVYDRQITIEGVTGRLVEADRIEATIDAGDIPVVIDPDSSILDDPALPVVVLVDARMTKRSPVPLRRQVALSIGLGPGFEAPANCDAVVETHRGHSLGFIYWTGRAREDTGKPDGDGRRVLRSTLDGTISGHKSIGDHCDAGDLIAEVQPPDGERPVEVRSPFGGVLRGLIRPGLCVRRGMKIGDIDPRDDRSYCFTVSDKALAIAGSVLEAVLARPDIRRQLWA